MNKKKVNIGFDIGITSVGWAIVDEDNNIIDRGVRLFDEVVDSDGKPNNAKRREKRSARRAIRRKRNRKDDFIKLIFRKYNNIFELDVKDNFNLAKEYFLKNVILNNENTNVLALILKGLNNEINKKELLRILYYYLSHRGFTYKNFDEEENERDLSEKIYKNIDYQKYAEWISKNKNLDIEEKKKEAKKYEFLNDFDKIKDFISAAEKFNEKKEHISLFPSEIQKNNFNRYGFFRNNPDNRQFSIWNWKKEIEKILSNQKYLTDDFKKDYIEIFQRIRDFSKGPGSSKSITPYGIWEKVNEEVKLKNESGNLWELSLGKCSVLPYIDNKPNYRSINNTVSAELSYLISELNNLIITHNSKENEKLTEVDKKKIIFEYISSSDKKITPKIFAKIIGVNKEFIDKFPCEEKKSDNTFNIEWNFQKMENTKKIFKVLKNELNLIDYDSIIANLNVLNEIVILFAQCNNDEIKIKEVLKQRVNDSYNDEVYKIINKFSESILNNLIKQKLRVKTTSKLSLIVLNEYLKSEIKNSGCSITKKYQKIIDKNKMDSFNFNNSKYINVKCMDDEILSPTTKRSFRETLKVFNGILKKYIYKKSYYLNNIVIEMTTESNNKATKKRYEKIKNENKKNNESIANIYGIDKYNTNLIEKFKLYREQDGFDVYSGEKIDEEKLKKGNYYDIDHIVPKSICHDNSFNNKVLVSSMTNSKKSDQTPKEYLSQNEYSDREKLWRRLYLLNDKSMNKKKYDMLTINLNDEKNMYGRILGFIGRNLSDTRYACRLIWQALKSWLKFIEEKVINSGFENLCPIGHEINLININGKETKRYRNSLDLPKDRNDYSHHAIDATICAMFGNDKKILKKILLFNNRNQCENNNFKFSLNELEELKIGEIKDKRIKDEISKKIQDANTKFSFKLTKKSNGELWNEKTISIIKKHVNTNNNLKSKNEDSYKKVVRSELMKLSGSEAEKLFEKLRHQNMYGDIHNPNYPDKKMWIDILEAFDWGVKISKKYPEYKNINPFILYMYEYMKIRDNINLLNHYDQLQFSFDEENLCNDISLNVNKNEYTHLILRRKNYEYKVKFIITDYKNANTFFPTNKIESKKLYDVNNNNKIVRIGVKESLKWLKLHLYLDSNNKYKIIPINVEVINKNTTSINREKLEKKLVQNNIDVNSKYFVIHKGTMLVNKNNLKDLIRVNGWTSDRLEYKKVYKREFQINKESKEEEIRNRKSISEVLKNYNFCNVDILGNVSVIKIEDIFKRERL